MANREHLKILKQGAQDWNIWRERNPLIKPNLSGARLKGMTLFQPHVISKRKEAIGIVQELDLSEVNFRKADLQEAILAGAELINADLRDANLREAILIGANLTHANLTGADFSGSYMAHTTFGNNDLSMAKGLEAITHGGPSFISTETLYRSGGRIPEQFLRGCGVPDEFITYLPALIGARQVIQYHSCFISYSTKDGEFARRLYSRMRDEHLRVWFAPEEVKGGQKLYEQIDRAIQIHDRLLLILSEHSMQSEWVITEIQRARKTEVEESRRKLFPITIVPFDKVKAWKYPDADSGRDLAKEVREYFIPDFSDWKNHDAFEKAFERLLRDLRAEEARA
jgi:hypothetical protein